VIEGRTPLDRLWRAERLLRVVGRIDGPRLEREFAVLVVEPLG